MKSKSSSSSASSFFIILFLVIVLIITALFASGFYKQFEGFASGKAYTLQYYYMPSCGYCDEFENKSWKPLESEIFKYPDKYNFSLVKYDITDDAEGHRKSNIYGVRGTPTILLVENSTGNYAVFNGNRNDYKELIKFTDPLPTFTTPKSST